MPKSTPKINEIHLTPEERLALGMEASNGLMGETKGVVQAIHETLKKPVALVSGLRTIINELRGTKDAITAAPKQTVTKLEEIKSANLINNQLLKKIETAVSREPEKFPEFPTEFTVKNQIKIPTEIRVSNLADIKIPEVKIPEYPEFPEIKIPETVTIKNAIELKKPDWFTLEPIQKYLDSATKKIVDATLSLKVEETEEYKQVVVVNPKTGKPIEWSRLISNNQSNDLSSPIGNSVISPGMVQGQRAMANSQPVTIASDQSAVPITIEEPDPLNEYDEDTAVVSTTETAILSYTVPAAKTANIQGVIVTGSATARYKLKVENATKAVVRTSAANRTESLDFHQGVIAATAGQVVTITGYHEEVANQTLEVNLIGYLS